MARLLMVLLGGALLAVTAARVYAQSLNPEETLPKTSEPAISDAQFIAEIAMDNNAQIEFGKLAQEKSENPAVSGYGGHMEEDHRSANKRLLDIARYLNITGLPADMSTKHKTEFKQLQGLQGESFDKAYIKSQIVDHQRAITLVKQQGDSREDEKLRFYAKSLLPLLSDHLKDAEEIQQDLSGGEMGKQLPGQAPDATPGQAH
jgi:putative membrane protein